MSKTEKAQKPVKPVRFNNFEAFKKASPPKVYTPLVQPRGYRVELVDWGNSINVSISKYVPNKGIRGVTIRGDVAEEVLEFALNLLRKALE